MNTRNQPCKCGSGKKTKRCCESIEAVAKRNKEAGEKWLAEYKERQAQLRKEREEYKAKDPENGPFTYRHKPSLAMIMGMAAAMSMGGR